MGTPIYDELIGRTRSADSGPADAGAGPVAEVAASCAWCGTPVGVDVEAVEFEAGDSETGEPVTFTVCSGEHRTALESHRSGAQA